MHPIAKLDIDDDYTLYSLVREKLRNCKIKNGLDLSPLRQNIWFNDTNNTFPQIAILHSPGPSVKHDGRFICMLQN